VVPDPNERDVAALHSIIAKRFRAALMTCGELLLGEESFRERLDKRSGNGGCFWVVGHSKASSAGIGRRLNKNVFWTPMLAVVVGRNGDQHVRRRG
jgi:hypothetical protein